MLQFKTLGKNLYFSITNIKSFPLNHIQVRKFACLSLIWLIGCGEAVIEEEIPPTPEEVRAELLERHFAIECSDIPPVFPQSSSPARSTPDRVPQDGAQQDNFNPFLLEEDFADFPLGVQAGAMQSNKALLWTKYDGDLEEQEVVLKVWREDPDDNSRLFIDEVTVEVKEGGYVHQYVEGLADSTWYSYAFFGRDVAGEDEIGEEVEQLFTSRSTVGRFRTAFGAEDRLKLKVGATTCTGNESPPGSDTVFLVDPENYVPGSRSPFTSLVALSEEDIDLNIHLGDIAYMDTVYDLEGYRTAWGKVISTEGYYNYFKKTGFYATWDDHEVLDNYGDRIEWFNNERSFPDLGGSDRVTASPELNIGDKVLKLPQSRFDAAFQTFFENLAVEDKSETDEHRIWNSYRWGKTAEFIITDLRYERIGHKKNPTNTTRIMSDEQLQFIKNTLTRAQDEGVHFKVVFTSVNIAGLNGAPIGWDAPLSRLDRWEGYPAQREELLNHIVDNDIENVWFISGDIHLGMITRLEPKGHKYGHMWEINVGPGGSARNGIVGPAQADERLAHYYNPENADKEIARYPIKSKEQLTQEQQDSAIELDKALVTNSFECDKVIFAHDQTEAITTFAFDPEINSVRITFKHEDGILFDEELQQEAPAIAFQ